VSQEFNEFKRYHYTNTVGDWNLSQAKLDHYNAWLMDPNRPLTSIYPGFPGTSKSKGTTMNTFQTIAQTIDSTTSMHATEKAKAPKAPKAPKDKGPRTGTKLAQATELVKATGKDDKEACIVAIVAALGVTRGNASIYYAKAFAALAK